MKRINRQSLKVEQLQDAMVFPKEGIYTLLGFPFQATDHQRSKKNVVDHFIFFFFNKDK